MWNMRGYINSGTSSTRVPRFSINSICGDPKFLLFTRKSVHYLLHDDEDDISFVIYRDIIALKVLKLIYLMK